ncbi:MAG TPA: NAD(+)/NADH kinase [Solirubrobacteraceae bacterium]
MADWVPARIALVVHPTRPIDQALRTLEGWAAEHGVPVLQLATGDGHRQVAEAGTLGRGDLVVAAGGDGTVLAALRAGAASHAPVLGVACGSLGALSAVAADELAEALGRVWAGDWTPRSLPALTIDAADDWALNDVVVVRRGSGQLVAEVAVDDELYVRLAGDGLVVATPVGSSAYSMAAGGPVLAAGTSAFVCTPLAMHGGSAPPLVVPADATVTVDVMPGFAGFDFEIDGQRRRLEALRFRIALQPDRATLVTFAPADRGLEGLRRRGLIADSPRVLARDDRASRAEVG